MRKQNDGQSADDILQNQFTAYLVTAVKRHKAHYARKKAQRQQIEAPLELHDFEPQSEPDLLTGLALLEQIENPMLYLALQQARDRERYIFLTRILEERSFSDLAEELGISYKATTHSYYRFIERIRKMMGGDE
ncbi:MAG: sigma-70 family RNA polymerase sigma factor [Clostridium sp.]|nr:sigma-70 family RNA polymerase sigma factor [Clostridium sp.]